MSDVAIKYNNETIGELNESGTATLKTSQKRCVSDIEVEYTKPAGGIDLPNISITVPEGFNARLISNTLLELDSNGNYVAVNRNSITYPFNGKYVPTFEYNKYSFSLRFPDSDEIYNMDINNIPATYEEGEWMSVIRDSNYNKTIGVNIVLRN